MASSQQPPTGDTPGGRSADSAARHEAFENASNPQEAALAARDLTGANSTLDPDTHEPRKWKIIGPGLVVAATGVGAADMVATLSAGSKFGYSLLWAVVVGVILKIVLVEGAGRYSVFEKISAVLVGIMFVVIVALAVIAAPDAPAMIAGLIPTIPEGSLFYTLALAGGVGGTITLAAYGYWLREKGWVTPGWMRVMRIDNTAAYVLTGIFVISMMIVGVEVVAAAGVSLTSGDKGLLELAGVLTDKYGDVIGYGFLIGFFAAAFSSVIGVWNGVSLMFADFAAHTLGKDSTHPDAQSGGKYFKFYLLWLTFPPMIMLALDQPIFLILLYGVLGALFMPFLAVTLLPLLNNKFMPKQWRNRWYTNALLAITALLFVSLGVYQVVEAILKVVNPA